LSPDRPVPRSTRRYYLWTPRPVMVDLQYLIEGFEGLSLVRTLDSRLGLLEVMVSPGAEAAFEEVLAELLKAYPQVRLASAEESGRRAAP